METTQQSLQNNTRAISNLEIQMGQISARLNDREKGTFPSQPQANPRGVHYVRPSSATYTDQVQAITTLRNGRVIDNQVRTLSEKEQEESNTLPAQGTPTITNDPAKDPTDKGAPENSYIPPAPFPTRLAKKKTGTYCNEILEIFKQVKINIPLLDAIKQVPSYAKFLKDLCTQKRVSHVSKRVFLNAKASNIISQKYPIKYKDPGSPTISCGIGNQRIEHALLDLGANVNLLPFSVYQQLGLGEGSPIPRSVSPQRQPAHSRSPSAHNSDADD